MGNSDQILSIVILDDNQFYNQLVVKRIESYFQFWEGIEFRIKAFNDPSQFLENMGDKIDIAFVDYYLDDDEYSGLHVMSEIFRVFPDCKVYMISSSRSDITSIVPKGKGASGFIYKRDKNAITQICECIEKFLENGTLKVS